MSYFIFNNIDSRDFGLLKRSPVINKSQTVANPVTIPDNPVKLYPATLNRDEISIAVTLGLRSREVLRSVYAWLDSIGTLSFSTEPDKFYIVQKTATSSEYLSARFAVIEITFICQPFAYAVNPTVQAVTASNTEVNNVGTVFSAPEIRFIPTSDSVIVTVNNVDFSVENLSQVGTQSLIGKEVVIDSEAHVTYFVGEDGRKWSVNDHTFNDYPRLHTGLNYVRHNGNVSEMSINVRERWL